MRITGRWFWLWMSMTVWLIGSAAAAEVDRPDGCQISGQLTGLAEHLLAIDASGANVSVMREVYIDNTITTVGNQSVECNLDGTFSIPEPVAPGRWLIRVDATYIINPRQREMQAVRLLLNKFRIDIAEDEANRVLEFPAAWAQPASTSEEVHRILDSERRQSTVRRSWSYRDLQISHLGRLEDREGVVAELESILQDPKSSPFWTHLACDALPEMRPVTASALATIERALSGPHKRWVIGAVSGSMRGEALPLLQAIVTLMDDEDPVMRSYAIRTIGRIAVSSDEEIAGTVEALIDGLRDEDTNVRFYSADYIGQLGPRAADAVPVLEERIMDTDGSTRAWSARALYSIDGRVDEPLRILIEILEGDDLEATWHAVLAVGTFGSDAAAAIPALERLQEYDGEPPFVGNEEGLKRYQNRRNALRALRDIDPETAAKYEDPSVR